MPAAAESFIPVRRRLVQLSRWEVSRGLRRVNRANNRLVRKLQICQKRVSCYEATGVTAYVAGVQLSGGNR